MKILIITLEKVTSGLAVNKDNVDPFGYGANEIARDKRQRVLPIQLLAIVGDIVDAGHSVHWPDESLNESNKDRMIAEAKLFDPDVLFFAGGDVTTQHLMESIAVKTNSVVGSQFLSAQSFCTAGYWSDMLAQEGFSVKMLLQKLADLELKPTLSAASQQ